MWVVEVNYFLMGLETASATLVVALVMWVIKLIKKHGQAHEDIPKRLEKIEAEFRPNGGYSQHDRQEAIYELMVQLAARQGLNVPRRAPRKP